MPSCKDKFQKLKHTYLFGSVWQAGYNNSHIEALMSKSTSALFHGVVHRLLGSESLQGESGDMTDVGTSPNEVRVGACMLFAQVKWFFFG